MASGSHVSRGSADPWPSVAQSRFQGVDGLRVNLYFGLTAISWSPSCPSHFLLRPSRAPQEWPEPQHRGAGPGEPWDRQFLSGEPFFLSEKIYSGRRSSVSSSQHARRVLCKHRRPQIRTGSHSNRHCIGSRGSEGSGAAIQGRRPLLAFQFLAEPRGHRPGHRTRCRGHSSRLPGAQMPRKVEPAMCLQAQARTSRQVRRLPLLHPILPAHFKAEHKFGKAKPA